MLFEKFINRTNELSELSDFFENSSGVSSISLIAGTSGVGKSEYTNEFARRYQEGIFIRVPCPVAPNDKTIKEGVFLRNISERLHGMSTIYNFPNIENFANSLETKALKKDYNNKLLEDISVAEEIFSVATTAFKMLKRQLGKFYTAEDFFKASQDLDPFIHYEYALHALNKISATIVLENFQLIDNVSRKFLYDLITEAKRASWIIEYTVSQESSEIEADMLRVFDELHKLANKQVKKILLSPVPFIEILSAGSAIIADKADVYESLHERYNGDLRALIDVSSVFAKNNDQYPRTPQHKFLDESDPTAFILESLSGDALLLFAIIVANSSRIEYNIARLIYEQLPMQFRINDFETNRKELLKKKILLCEEEIFRISHDRLVSTYLSSKLRRGSFSFAAKATCEFYEDYIRSKSHDIISRREAIIRISKIRLQTNPLMVFDHFSQLREIVLESATHDEASRFIESLINALTQMSGISENIWWQIAHLCYEANLHKLALRTAEDSWYSCRWRLLRGLIWHSLDNNDQGLKEADAGLASAQTTHGRFSCLLLKILCLRSDSQFPAAEALIAEIFNIGSYKDIPEYAYFLNLLESIRPPQEGLLHAKESIRLLEEMSLHKQKFKAEITWTIQLARTGAMKEALSKWEELEASAHMTIADRYMIWNNQCATEMMSGKCVNEQKILLKRALLICSANFDRIVIKCNLALWHGYCDEIAEALRQLNDIAPLIDKEADARIKCVYFFNQAQIAALAHDEPLAYRARQELKKEAVRVDDGFRDYWLIRSGISKIGKNDEGIDHLLSLKFHHPFLAHWSFPLRYDIE